MGYSWSNLHPTNMTPCPQSYQSTSRETQYCSWSPHLTAIKNLNCFRTCQAPAAGRIADHLLGLILGGCAPGLEGICQRILGGWLLNSILE